MKENTHLRPMTSDERKESHRLKRERIDLFIASVKNKTFRLESIPSRYQNLFHEIYSSLDKTLLRKRLNAKCLDCCWFVTEEITNCDIKRCPIWPMRPYQKEIKQ